MGILMHLDKGINILIKFFEYFIISLLIALVSVSLSSVFSRFFLNSSLVWADEFMRYCSIWMVFIASPVLIIQKGHLAVDMTSIFFPKRLWKPLFIMGYFMCLLFLCLLFPQSIMMVKLGAKQISSAMGVNMALVYSCMPISIVLMIISFIRLIIGEFIPDTKKDDE